jgi:hypothetical protein
MDRDHLHRQHPWLRHSRSESGRPNARGAGEGNSKCQLAAERGPVLDVEVRDGEQFVRGKRTIASAARICVFVVVKGTGHDEFYVFPWEDLQDILLQDYKAGARPKNPDTLHHALYPKRIERFKDNWMAIERAPKPSAVID